MPIKILRPGQGANHDPRISLMRAATTAATTRHNSGGLAKSRGLRAKQVTLSNLESLRRIMGQEK